MNAPAAQSFFRQSSASTLLTRPIGEQFKANEEEEGVEKPKAVLSKYNSGFCVRLCDGFYFPSPIVRVSENRLEVQNEICASLCSGSPTLFYNGNDIKRSVNSQGQKYLQLPTANRFKHKLDKTCSCRANAGLGIGYLRYTHDFTLRTGDIVLFDHQPKVFLGSDKFPFDKVNFQNPRPTPWLNALYLNPAMSEKAKPNDPSTSWKLASVVYSMTDARIAENAPKPLRLIAPQPKEKAKHSSLRELLDARASFDN